MSDTDSQRKSMPSGAILNHNANATMSFLSNTSENASPPQNRQRTPSTDQFAWTLGAEAGGSVDQPSVATAARPRTSIQLPIAPERRRSFGAASPSANGGPLSNGNSARRSVVFPRRRQSRIAAGLQHGSPGPINPNVYSVVMEGDDGGVEVELARPHLRTAAELRPRYKSMDKGQNEPQGERMALPIPLHNDTGVYVFGDQHTVPVPWEQYYDDVTALYDCVHQASCHSACNYRLQVLEEKYSLYKLCNAEHEANVDRYRRGGGIFAHSYKVDNSISLEHMMSPQSLLEFIQETVEMRGNDVVLLAGSGKEPQSLQRVCETLEFPELSMLTADGLGLQPSPDKPITSYDLLNPAINQGGRNSAALLRLFLSRNTHNNGEYLADAVRPCLARNDSDPRRHVATEAHFEITGLTSDEWSNTAQWMRDRHILKGFKHNRWIAALPRAKMHETGAGSGEGSPWDGEGRRKSIGEGDAPESPSRHNDDEGVSQLEHHQQHLDNIFLPLFMATISPEDPHNSAVADLLNNMGGLVIIPDENDRANKFERRRRRPADVPWSEAVSDLYFAYYVWANVCSLNALRQRRGLNTLQLRFVAGSSQGSGTAHLDSLVFSYLLSDLIVNGIALTRVPVLQYLYGLHGIGIAMSPMSSNALGTADYALHPFPALFRRGLKVTLCTSAPLMFHHTEDPLLEEYATACRMYRLSAVDMCEVALNSVLMSTFPDDDVKEEWIGEGFLREGWRGNLHELTNVPTARLELRHDTWHAEREVVLRQAAAPTMGAAADGAAAATELRSGSLSMPVSPTPTIWGQMDTTATDPRVTFPRVRLIGPIDRGIQQALAAQALMRCMELRSHYVRQRESKDDQRANVMQETQNIEQAFRRDTTNAFDEDEWKYKTVEGIVVPHEVHQIPRLPQDMYHYEDFRSHVSEVRAIVENPNVRSFALRRLQLLENRFKLHIAVNHSQEAGSTASKASSNRDFYQATKVDNAVRMEAGMTARQLLDFIIHKARNCGDDIVSHQEGREPQTLRQLLQELKIAPDSLTVDDLNVQVDTTQVGVISAEDTQFIPEGRDELLALLLKTDNQMQGRYFAELTKLTFENLERDRFTFTENRLPIYGASSQEWSMLSSWFDTHGMASSHNSWMVQVPRIYGYLRRQGKVKSFAEYLENIFTPLWLVSLHPNKDPRLFHFVTQISGFDCVADERRLDIPLHMATKAPHDWTSEEDPPYNYYLYHMWANIYSLNAFRRRRNFSQFSFRPSCGESGSLDHLIGGYLLSNSVTYGVQLDKDMAIQYLFYLSQIGVTMCPLSNNTRVLGYLDNPLPKYFRRGLLVSLGTDNPLKYHHTQEALLEEYSIASKVWKFSANDMCELARNSVLLSGFSAQFKKQRLGEQFYLSSSSSNDASRTHLSDIRVAYRFETYHGEMSQLESISGQSVGRALFTLREEQREMAYLADAQGQSEKPSMSGIIDANADEGDLDSIQNQRSRLRKELDDLTVTVEELQKHNKQLTEKLYEERERDQLAAQMRREKMDNRIAEDKLGHLKQLLLSSNTDYMAAAAHSRGDAYAAGTADAEAHDSAAAGAGEEGGNPSRPTTESPMGTCNNSRSQPSPLHSGNRPLSDAQTTRSSNRGKALLHLSEALWSRQPLVPESGEEQEEVPALPPAPSQPQPGPAKQGKATRLPSLVECRATPDKTNTHNTI